ncbi:hypothetical protein NHX12_032924 [Muraenolepis orangiensis]|uniref:Uncharacterized protein n=1 Tax=Muraenolepis orangiensis TaxID=630683 RepID=A0A9Q0IJ53_9TELE|nr:hypothetical protein NHX12_032924 [Muraenolepis orangiensis]
MFTRTIVILALAKPPAAPPQTGDVNMKTHMLIRLLGREGGVGRGREKEEVRERFDARRNHRRRAGEIITSTSPDQRFPDQRSLESRPELPRPDVPIPDQLV